MTEDEWLACEDPALLLTPIVYKLGSRKLRLFACGCCRLVWPIFTKRASRLAVQTAEKFADGETKLQVMAALRNKTTSESPEESMALATCQPSASSAVYSAISEDWVTSAAIGLGPLEYGNPTPVNRSERGGAATQQVCKLIWRQQAALMRDIFHFCPITIDPAWRTDTAIALARQMYDSREFGAMPILADALQDAGCDNEDILNHCRGDGPHVRGCWVVDLVLGKE